ncbi:hypothetical protein V7O66_06070 [Methanolobus sp. ZRKC3]|uniref:hypothetical protein n=1 Tax=Methanolobus sp. ZRKC3 TaxID=3125786 RepID=UPI0032456C74
MLRDLTYAMIPYPIHKKIVEWKCKFGKQDEQLVDSHLALYPHSLDINKVIKEDINKCVSFLPYCAKPMGDHECPVSDKVHKRKNQRCMKISGGKCDVPCTLGDMVDVLMKHGFTKNQIFIIDKDANLFPWLVQKRKEGYEYFMPGVGCKYGVSYAIDYIGKKLGYKGCIAFIDDYCSSDTKNGVCKCMGDYIGMEGLDKGKMTKMHKSTIIMMENILSGNYKTIEDVTRSPPHKDEISSSV